MAFECSQCGACCKGLVTPVPDELNKGDGSCKNLNGNKCNIYESRPDFCRNDVMFKKSGLSKLMTSEQYYEYVTNMCRELGAINAQFN